MMFFFSLYVTDISGIRLLIFWNLRGDRIIRSQNNCLGTIKPYDHKHPSILTYIVFTLFSVHNYAYLFTNLYEKKYLSFLSISYLLSKFVQCPLSLGVLLYCHVDSSYTIVKRLFTCTAGDIGRNKTLNNNKTEQGNG